VQAVKPAHSNQCIARYQALHWFDRKLGSNFKRSTEPSI
jgi:hypothetical protein